MLILSFRNILKHALAITFLLTVPACTDSSDTDINKVTILKVFGEPIYLHDIKATPPSDEKSEFYNPPFHNYLAYLVQEKVINHALNRWNVDVSDNEILAYDKVTFVRISLMEIDRKKINRQLKSRDPIAIAYQYYLDGMKVDEIKAKLKSELNYSGEMWERLLPNKKYVEASLKNHNQSRSFMREYYNRTDAEIKADEVSSIVAFLRPKYHSLFLAKAICDDDDIPLKSRVKPIILGDKCVDFAAHWLSVYMKTNTTVLNPIASDFVMGINYHENFELLQSSLFGKMSNVLVPSPKKTPKRQEAKKATQDHWGADSIDFTPSKLIKSQ